MNRNFVKKWQDFKTLTFLSILILMFSSSIGVRAEIIDSGVCGRSINEGGKRSVTWSLDDNGLLLISGSGAMAIYDDDEAPWYYGHSSFIKEVIIEDGVTTIGDNAFCFCTSLEKVSVPNSIIWVGSGAFDYTPWYENLPDGLIYLGKCLYKYKGEMPSGTIVDIKEGIQGISSSAFNNEKGLVAINIPEGVTQIGSFAFRNTSLASISIPNSVTNIGEDAFTGCGLLKSAIIGDGITYIGNYVFYGCGLTSITFGKNVSGIGEYAFSQNSSLTSVTFGENIKHIGNYAFYNCRDLSSITISNKIQNIDYKAFYECPSLTDIFFLGTEEEWENISIGDYNNVLYASTKYFSTDITNKIENNDFSESSIYMKSEKVIYDLQGRCVLNPTKGLYIINGRKIIVE